MSEQHINRVSWLFVALLLVAAAVIFQGWGPAALADDHEQAHALRDAGGVMPLSELLRRPELAGQRVLEAELEDEHGRRVYELELLGSDGRVHERYYDAVTGSPVKHDPGD